MKKLIVLFLVLLLIAVPVAAGGYYVVDDSGLLRDDEVAKLEEICSDYPVTQGFAVAVVTADNFGGLSAAEFAGKFYDTQGYQNDGILLLVSLGEGEWYILTNGECADRLSDWDTDAIGEEIVPLIRDGQYYAAFLKFPELAEDAFEANAPTADDWDENVTAAPAIPKKIYGKTIAISMAVGVVIGLITVGIMSVRMKTVRHQNNAADYVRPGSMRLTTSRDIFLYSHVTRTPRPKSNSSSGGRSGGISRGGSGGRI